jgi:hypothetical protein
VGGAKDGELAGVHACHEEKVPKGLWWDAAMVCGEVAGRDGGKAVKGVGGVQRRGERRGVEGGGEPVEYMLKFRPLWKESAEAGEGMAKVIDGVAAEAGSEPLDGGNCARRAVQSGPFMHGSACSDWYGVFKGETARREGGYSDATGEEAFAEGGAGKEGGEGEKGERFGRENDDEVAAISADGVAKHQGVGVREDAYVGDG